LFTALNAQVKLCSLGGGGAASRNKTLLTTHARVSCFAMVFEKITPATTLADIPSIYSNAKITGSESAILVEKTPSGDMVYHLEFENTKLKRLKANFNADFAEAAYVDLAALAIAMIEANKTNRGLGNALVEQTVMPWKQLIESPLPEASERAIEGLHLLWNSQIAQAELILVWIWPGQLCLNYSEEIA